MRLLGYAGFALFAALFAGLFALAVYATLNDHEDDKPEVAARKAECRKLAAHLFEISPVTAGQDPAPLVAAVPIEDIEQCAAEDAGKDKVDHKPAAVRCMFDARSEDALRTCIPKHAE